MGEAGATPEFDAVDEADAEFAAFFREMAPRAFRIARTIVRRDEIAEEVAAEALTRAYVAWWRVRMLPHRERWLLRVTSNVAVDTVRRLVREEATEALLDSLAEQLPVGEILDLRAALPKLSSRQRRVVVLRYVAGMSQRDIAELLGVSEGAVKRHAHRGLQRLRSLLDTGEGLSLDTISS